LLALAEFPDHWSAAFAAFRAELPPGIDLDEARLVAQTLLGSWPVVEAAWDGYPGRIARYLEKALREAKRSTSWTDPDDVHEALVLSAAGELLEARGTAFDRHFGDVRRRLARAGAAISLARVVLQHALPGAPDVYRGAERWALDLADPDNRRPVDHDPDVATLRAWAAAPPDLAELRRHWTDGRIKLWCTWRALRARRARPDLFVDGTYTPCEITGPGADALLAFERRRGHERAVAVVSRRAGYGATTDGFPIGWAWAGTEVAVDADGPPLRDALRPDAEAQTERRVEVLLRELPVALLVTDVRAAD
jgi:(1->4)-alpha-D-glucan 1-alpha-D-glucosylmutase